MELVWAFVFAGTKKEKLYPKKVLQKKFLRKASGLRKEKIRRWYRGITGVPQWYNRSYLQVYLADLKGTRVSRL